MNTLICCACPDQGVDAQTCGENQGEHACKPCPCDCHGAQEVEMVPVAEMKALREEREAREIVEAQLEVACDRAEAWKSMHRQACAERDRLRAGLEMLAQVRHVCGSAQGHMRQQLRFVDAILAGGDLRDVETVEAIAEGRWTTTATTMPGPVPGCES